MVIVEVSGFKKETRKDIALVVNSSTRIDVQLTPGNITETSGSHRGASDPADRARRHWPQLGCR
jgi:hypothetical protein